MAAIDLTRLDRQIDQLADLYQDPAAFKEELHAIFSFYHRYAHRRLKDTVSKSFMQTYDLPEKVLPHLEARLRPLSQRHPDQVLTLTDLLWQDRYYETRELATSLLGNLPISHQAQTLKKIESWLQQPLDRAVVDAIINNAARTIISEAPRSWKELILRLLDSGKPQSQKMGLLALASLIPNTDSNEVPAFFGFVREFLISRNTGLDKHLYPVIEALAKKSQQETVYLLREVLADSNDAEVGRRIRHYLEFFNEPGKSRVLNAIKNQVILPKSTNTG